MLALNSFCEPYFCEYWIIESGGGGGDGGSVVTKAGLSTPLLRRLCDILFEPLTLLLLLLFGALPFDKVLLVWCWLGITDEDELLLLFTYCC
jgi:hypothetical protein